MPFHVWKYLTLPSQNEKMRRRLASLGFAMALEPVPNFKNVDPNVFDISEADPGKPTTEHRRAGQTTSSHTAGRSAPMSGMPTSPRPTKRQRIESPFHFNKQDNPPTSRDAMPPPPNTVSRMQSVRKIFPSWRKKHPSGRPSPVPGDALRNNGATYGCENKGEQGSNDDRPFTRSGPRSNATFMSGALPAEPLTRAAHQPDSRLLSSVGVGDSRSDFTFRASSPVKMSRPNAHQPVQLPSEPSYLRLMDGLSRDTGLELGLKDPRENPVNSPNTTNGYGHVMNMYEEQQQAQGRDNRARWSLGHPFLHQSPSRPSQASGQLHSPRPGPNYNFIRAEQPTHGPVTPAHDRHQRSGNPIESVVSPFFESRHHYALPYSRAGFAEPQDSSHRFGAYQSQGFKRNGAQAGWHEPRSLNGLSFFDSPMNSCNEPIQYGHRRGAAEPTLPFRYCRNRNLEYSDYPHTPGAARSSYVGTGALELPRNDSLLSTQRFRASQSTGLFPSFHRSSRPLPYQLPSTMPPALPDRQSVWARPWDSLQRVGVRSSRHGYGSHTVSRAISPRKGGLSVTGRRSVRR